MVLFGKCVERVGFPLQFIRWIITCIYSVSYSILINGAPSRPFKAKKSLWQGDLMSPFLFAIAMEYFSRVLNKLKGDAIAFHPKCRKSEIMELMFADDLLIFTKPDA